MVRENEFLRRLKEEFDSTSNERQKVVRQARLLEDSGIFVSNNDEIQEFTIDSAISSMGAAPGHLRITGKWNWWMGLLNTGDDDFERFKC